MVGRQRSVVLGLSVDPWQPAACVLVDGLLAAVAQDPAEVSTPGAIHLPVRSMRWVLDQAQVGHQDLDCVAIHGKPFSDVGSEVAVQARRGPRHLLALAGTVRACMIQRLWVAYRAEEELVRLGLEPPEIFYVERAMGRAAATFHPSPFESAAVVVIDGPLPTGTITIARGAGHQIEILEQSRSLQGIDLSEMTLPQPRTDEALIGLLRRAQAVAGEQNLCVSAPGLLLSSDGALPGGDGFDRLHLPPPGEDIGAIGAARWAWHQVRGHQRPEGPAGGAVTPRRAHVQRGPDVLVAGSSSEQGRRSRPVLGSLGRGALLLLSVPVLPVVYAFSLLRAAGDGLRRLLGRSEWIEGPRVEVDPVRAAKAPFRSVGRAERRRRTSIAVVLSVGVVLVATLVLPSGGRSAGPGRGPGAGLARSERTPPSNVALSFSQLPAYEGVEFADALQQDQVQYLAGLGPSAVGGIQAADHAGPYTNVTDGVRRTAPSTCACPVVRLWLVGGSAAFGLGQRDDHTIASVLVELAAREGVALEVTNLAVPGRTLWQEYEEVEARLARPGVVAPDVVVSYGGFNDAVGALISAAVGEDPVEGRTVHDNEQIARWSAQGFEMPDGLTIERTASIATERFLAVQAMMDDLAESHGFATAYFVHPDALASPSQFAPVADIYPAVPATIADEVGAQLEAVSSALSDDAVDLRHLFDDLDRSVFVDWAHTNEYGAELAAAAVFAEIRSTIIARSEGR